MEPTIPENSQSFTVYLENSELFQSCVDQLLENEHNVLISRTDYYAPQGSENFAGTYMQNMNDGTFHSFENADVQKLMDLCGVKLIDLMRTNGLEICSFDMCVPGRNFDYGIYYVSEDRPIYLGNVSYPLVENGSGFSYEQKASYGTKFVFYTEKIADHFYYYEIS